MPKNTSIGLFIGIFSFLLSFGLIWYMYWLALSSTIGIVVCLIVRLSQKHVDYYLLPEEVEKMENRKQNA